MFRPQEGIGERGEAVPGPPWVLGHRGAPLLAPENTLASLSRALELGADGVEYDVRRCGTGEPVLLHDERLERTTDGEGRLDETGVLELAPLDAGAWFHKRYVGEAVPFLEEALDLVGPRPDARPLHMVELKEPGLCEELARLVSARPGLALRVGSFRRDVCLAARDLGLPAMLLAEVASEDDRRFTRDERLAAYGVGPGGWWGEAGEAEWRCERWGWSIDEPAELDRAVRAPLFAFNTNEPERALAARALALLSPGYERGWPLQVPLLEVPIGASDRMRGEWCGEWSLPLLVQNPFPFRVGVELALVVRKGAFEVGELPAPCALEPGAALEFELGLAGGSWAPGGDPLLAVRFSWEEGPGRPLGKLVLDAPLHRRRSLRLRAEATRLEMLREAPSAPPASMSVRRQGQFLIAVIEHAGELDQARALVRLGGQIWRGSQGVRVRLPDGFDQQPAGQAFSVGFEGRLPSEDGPLLRVRRWTGGLPEGVHSGAPGRLLPPR